MKMNIRIMNVGGEKESKLAAKKWQMDAGSNGKG